MSVYYNEFDPHAAGWLRNLSAAGRIPQGHVDERDIRIVRAGEIAGFRQVHLFAGIGGWPLALSLSGWPPDRPIWTCSFPCQPFSIASPKAKGVHDERHLWPVGRELIAQLRPPTIFGEQVASSAGKVWLAGIRADLEALGYRFAAADLCAAGVGAPQIRQRLFWVADSPNADGRPGERGKETGTRPFQIGGGGVSLLRLSGWATPNCWDAFGSHGGGQGASLRTDAQMTVHGTKRNSDGEKTEKRGALNPALEFICAFQEAEAAMAVMTR